MYIHTGLASCKPWTLTSEQKTKGRHPRLYLRQVVSYCWCSTWLHFDVVLYIPFIYGKRRRSDRSTHNMLQLLQQHPHTYMKYILHASLYIIHPGVTINSKHAGNINTPDTKREVLRQLTLFFILTVWSIFLSASICGMLFILLLI